MTFFHLASLLCALGGAVIQGIVLARHGVPGALRAEVRPRIPHGPRRR